MSAPVQHAAASDFPQAPAPRAAERRYRPEVQGLRALAVVLVVLYHVWLGRVSGGVDVFLLISAFLLTGSFIRKAESGKALALGRYWLHLFKRLLPAVAVVLLAVLAAAAALLPASARQDLIGQTWSSLFYFQNWTLANNAVDYLAADHSAASPLQHFWSLSIQGQVFVLWPLIFAAALPVSRLAGRSYRSVLAVIFTAVFAVSLAYSVWQTGTNQAYAYFDTRTRLWEFALGSLLALALPYLRLGHRVRILIGWTGVIAMLSCGIILQVQQQFPGYLALWPTLAAAMVIAAGDTGSRIGADRLLKAGPLVRLGDNSYALYLWHWPVLVFWLIASKQQNAGLVDGAVVIAVSLLLAVLTTKLVEGPLRGWSWPQVSAWRSAVVLAASFALVAAPLAGWQERVDAQAEAVRLQSIADNPGALSLDPDYETVSSTQALVKPAPSEMDQEWAQLDEACGEAAAPEAGSVLEGHCKQIGTAEGSQKTIVVLGDSHAMQWTAALGPVARANDWHVVTVLKMGCRYGAEDPERSEECNAFNQAAGEYVLDLMPDAVFTVASLTRESSPDETLGGGYDDGVRPFTEAGIQVLAMRDNPRFEFDMFKCLESNGFDVRACHVPRSQLLADVSPLEGLEARIPGVRVLDLSDQFCFDDACPGIIGNVIVYKDHDHLNRTYMETTSRVLAERILAATGWEGVTVPGTT
ncbi:acyltransferase family protein [Arthrobacter koreensis]|uniref:acyltransferase family protein n=1 Tax=Arthrobacter koreensis TaxID=199136 RepID=UPI001D01973E|nr:acyltransferase family protein [Arthrobacter koreensis]